MSLADTHGTRSCYVQRKCRCEACAAANRRYESDRARINWADRLEHQWTTPDRAVAHLNDLRAAGMGLRQVMAHTGISRTTLQELGIRHRISRATEARILAVRPSPADGARVDGIGTARRLQALMAIGWSGAQLGDRLGWTTSNLWTMILGRGQVQVATARKVADLYDELWDQPGDRRRSVNLARRNGWVPPMAWDDDTIDDPAAQPHTPKALGSAGRLPPEYVAEDFLDTFDHHQGDIHIAAHRLGMKPKSLERALYRARAAGHDIKFHGDAERASA